MGLAAVLAATAMFVLVPAVPQDLGYHTFADERPLPLCAGCGIPNAQNVVTNAPFFFVGLAGMRMVWSADTMWGIDLGPAPEALSLGADMATQGERLAWFTYFAGIFLTSLGSAYYHWRPNSPRLFWDRLPMTIGMSVCTTFSSTKRSPTCILVSSHSKRYDGNTEPQLQRLLGSTLSTSKNASV